ncbi:MAG: hypothetical protein KF815_07335 [Rhodospirillales bacterium]|nr:hypothetical protein [Rhodospirillales bacterium]
MSDRTNAPLVPLAGLYENTSKNGNRYFSGFLGKARVVMFENRDAKEGEPGWTLFVQERQEKPREARPVAAGGGAARDATANAARVATAKAKVRTAPAPGFDDSIDDLMGPY